RCPVLRGTFYPLWKYGFPAAVALMAAQFYSIRGLADLADAAFAVTGFPAPPFSRSRKHGDVPPQRRVWLSVTSPVIRLQTAMRFQQASFSFHPCGPVLSGCPS
ncbi:hypothetical protein ACC690_14815, partial [Rhizobium johnstonii]|uniref:hypothetical protein n=1 Tax=Rhizobium johnstonii TaxID=3019933 RepID=UPI003F98A9FC